MIPQIRSHQRFQNFTRAYELVKKISALQNPQEIERLALIQAFELCFELSWKMLKDYFYEGGREISNPRDILKQAVQDGILKNGEGWLNALQSRNLASHVYDEETAEEIAEDIHDSYITLFTELYEFFQKKIS